MIRNYFKIAIRNFWRNKGFSAINIIGLAIGIASCLIIMLFVQNELGYDRFNDKANRMVKVYFQGNVQGQKMNEASIMPPVAQTLKNDFPEVEAATRLRDFGRPKMVYDGKSFRDDAMAFVDANFFQVFTLPLLEGNTSNVLTEPNTVVITKAMAKKYFGNANPIGKIITLKDQTDKSLKVTGLIDKVPLNSHFHFDMFTSMASLPEAQAADWMVSNFHTYLVLAKNKDYHELEAKLPQVVEKYMGPQMQQAMGISLADFRKKGNNLSLYLLPLTDIHLHSDATGDLSASGDIRYVYIFGAIALFMLLIACINFMNLSTAGAYKRSKEVGIRKVLGSLKQDLIKQFLIESILICTVAFALAFVLMKIALPLFNSLANQQLSLSFADNPLLIPKLIGLVLLVGVLAGSYPAFYLSSFKPVAVLKGKFVSGKQSISLRSGLVVFQFFISIVLIVSTIVVYRQLSFIQNKKLGYDKDQVLILSNTWMLGNRQEAFRQQLASDPRIASVTASGYLPAGNSFNNNFFISPDNNVSQMTKTLRYDVDINYLATLGMELEAGRNFSSQMASDSSAVLLNETAAKILGWGNNAIGHSITHANNQGVQKSYQVIGIVKDFHFRSLHERISPLVMTLAPNPGILIAKLKTADIAGVTASLSKQWAVFGVEEPMDYSFLDDRFNQSYAAEQNTGKILAIFAALTISVACMGLFGLATFTARQRSKEIGIRKVLGASATNIVSLLSKDFLKLVGIAFIIAAPVSWLAMSKWLEDFAYRANLTWWIFGIAAIAAIAITLATVSVQAIKAALANPVKSIGAE